tara:strand:+ start:944 stop:1525 length:582 start_codon:yes stop_codon:yes gene_type:complete
MNSDKIKNNLIKLSHSVVVSALSSFYLYLPNIITKNLIFFTSVVYFINDTKNLLKCEIIDYPIIYHHIAALFLLFAFYIDYYGLALIYVYNAAEISNISMYITYHLIQTNSSKNLILYSNILQTFMYGYFRIYITTDYIIKNNHLLYTPLSMLAGIYIIGWVWFLELCKQLYTERLTIKYLVIDTYDRLLQNI